MRIAPHAGVFAIGLLALRAAADVSGGASPFVTVTSATGFVPVTWSEPTNGIGFGGGGRHGGSGPVPFAGWVDFGLLRDPSVTVEWDFTNEAPSRWLGWSVARLDARDTPIAGVSWDGASWQALGDAAASADASGSLALPLVEQAGRQDLRLSFWGITSEPAGLVSPPITFAVPAPGAGALVAVAMVVARRRRG